MSPTARALITGPALALVCFLFSFLGFTRPPILSLIEMAVGFSLLFAICERAFGLRSSVLAGLCFGAANFAAHFAGAAGSSRELASLAFRSSVDFLVMSCVMALFAPRSRPLAKASAVCLTLACGSFAIMVVKLIFEDGMSVGRAVAVSLLVGFVAGAVGIFATLPPATRNNARASGPG
jgi:hypothetical protein